MPLQTSKCFDYNITVYNPWKLRERKCGELFEITTTTKVTKLSFNKI